MLEPKERIAAYKTVLGTPAGQTVLEDLLAFSKLHSGTIEADLMIRILGRADVTMRFIEMSQAQIPEETQQEPNEDEHTS